MNVIDRDAYIKSDTDNTVQLGFPLVFPAKSLLVYTGILPVYRKIRSILKQYTDIFHTAGNPSF